MTVVAGQRRRHRGREPRLALTAPPPPSASWSWPWTAHRATLAVVLTVVASACATAARDREPRFGLCHRAAIRILLMAVDRATLAVAVIGPSSLGVVAAACSSIWHIGKNYILHFYFQDVPEDNASAKSRTLLKMKELQNQIASGVCECVEMESLKPPGTKLSKIWESFKPVVHCLTREPMNGASSVNGSRSCHIMKEKQAQVICHATSKTAIKKKYLCGLKLTPLKRQKRTLLAHVLISVPWASDPLILLMMRE